MMLMDLGEYSSEWCNSWANREHFSMELLICG